jgi:8-oxo-dGTP diphosphatase
MKQRNKAIPASYLLLEKDGKYLLARRHNTGYQDGNYQTPAGHVDEGELPSEALIREAKEEVGINIKPEDIELVHISYRPKHDNTDNRVDFFFRVRKWSGDVINMEPEKCDELLWVDPKQLPKNVTPHVRDAIKNMLLNNYYQELGLDFIKNEELYAQ